MKNTMNIDLSASSPAEAEGNVSHKRASLSFIPPLLPNQTLYSWASVFHEMSGNASIKESWMQLFGMEQGRLHFHIPSHLNEFCASTQLTLGSAETIANTATTIPFYTRFRQPLMVASILNLIRGKSLHGLAKDLVISKNPPYDRNTRRSCYQCIKADHANFEFAYWHRDHQLPGVLICPQHGTPLMSLPHAHHTHKKETLLWPENDWHQATSDSPPKFSDSALATLQCLAQLATEIVRSDLDGGYSPDKMLNTCLRMLKVRDLVSPSGDLLTAQAMQAYKNHFKSVLSIPELAATVECSLSPLLYIQHKSDRRIHPLEWMLIIYWLFEGWSTFKEYYRNA